MYSLGKIEGQLQFIEAEVLFTSLLFGMKFCALSTIHIRVSFNIMSINSIIIVRHYKI